MNTNLLKEKELLEQAKVNKENFEALYQYFLNDVFRFSYSLLNNQHDAEDTTAQTFIILYNQLDSFKWQDISIKFWLFRTAKNLALKQLRQKQKIELDETAIVSENNEISFVDTIIEKDLINRVKEEIEKLHPEERAIINLRIWEGLNFKEIGELNNISEDAARMRFNRSIKKLRHTLEKKNIRKLLSLPILFTAIYQAGTLPSYAAPASLLGIGITSLLAQNMTILTTIKSVLATKAGTAAIVGLLTVTTAGGAIITYEQKASKKEQTPIVLQPTPEIIVPTETSPTTISTIFVPVAAQKTYFDSSIKLAFEYPSNFTVTAGEFTSEIPPEVDFVIANRNIDIKSDKGTIFKIHFSTAPGGCVFGEPYDKVDTIFKHTPSNDTIARYRPRKANNEIIGIYYAEYSSEVANKGNVCPMINLTNDKVYKEFSGVSGYISLTSDSTFLTNDEYTKFDEIVKSMRRL